MSVEEDPIHELETALSAHMAAGCQGGILEIQARRRGLACSMAQGLFARHDSRPLQPQDAFRVASVTKAFTATLAVHLAANRHWDLDDPIVDFLPTPVTGILRKLNNRHQVKELTIRRLLNHTSGIPDYFTDDRFRAHVRHAPDHIWQPEELVEVVAEAGELLFPSGTDFSYGDTGYILVGLGIEHLLAQPLADAYRSRIFEPLGMEATYLEWREAPRVASLSHHYEGSEDLVNKNYSYGWAAGGLVTTAGDLTRFLQGLFGEALLSRQWLSELTTWHMATRWRPHGSDRYVRYGLGLGLNFAYGEEIIGATGIWGAFAYYWPAGEVTITGTLNVVGADRSALMDSVIRALKRHGSPL
jgi:D-alanyl-D-alanine carboxypeptidase